MTSRHTSQHHEPGHTPARKTVRAIIILISLLSGISVVDLAGQPAQADEGSPFRIVDRVPIEFPPGADVNTRNETGWLLLNPSTRRGYELTTTAIGVAPTAIFMRSFDLDSLQTVKRRTIRGASGGNVYVLTQQTNNNGGAGVVHAIDQQGGRIFLPVANASGPSPAASVGGGPDAGRPFDSMVVINEKDFESDAADADVFNVRRRLSAEEQLLTATHSLNGLQYFGMPGAGRLLLLWADWKQGFTHGAALKNHQLFQWGVDGNSNDNWTRQTLLTAACGRARLNGSAENKRAFYPLAILRGPTYIVIACQKADGVTQVVQVELNATGQPDPDDPVVEIRTLGRRYGDTIADQANERFLVRSQLQGNAWWVYDARKRTWAGAVGVALGDNGFANSAGLDPVSGRLYTLAPDHLRQGLDGLTRVTGGFGFSDTRLTPAPQLQIPMPELAYPSRIPIVVDSGAPGRPRRVFVRRGMLAGACLKPASYEYQSCDADEHFLVIEDNAPIPVTSDPADPDRYTTDVNEQRGVTAANFDRSASGFGLRVMSISGLSGATNRSLDGGGPVGHGSPCPPEDREVVFGEVAFARANNAIASAQANAVRIDTNTASELDDPVRQCWPTPSFAQVQPNTEAPPVPSLGAAFPTTSTSCTGDDDKPAVSETGPFSQTAAAKCAASTGGFDSSGAVTSLVVGDIVVGSASTRTWVAEDSDHPERGLVTHVESISRGVKLGSAGSIGLIRATARAWSAGRPGTAGTAFDREICQVRLGAFADEGCLDKERQRQFTTEFNRRMVGNAEIVLRDPDEAYKAGTPGGYQAAVQRDRNQQFVDRIMTRDFSKTVPALELVVYRDDGAYGAAREVVQFAGVEATSQYGIYCLFGSASPKRCNAAFGDGDSPPYLESGPLALSDAILGSPGKPPLAATVLTPEKKQDRGIVHQLFRRLAQLPEDIARLILSGPRELLLTAGVWSLMWLPCLLGDRRRAARRALVDRLEGVGA